MEFFIKLYNLYTMKSNLIVPIKNFYIWVIKMDNKKLGIIGAIIIIIVIIICAFAFLGGNNPAIKISEEHSTATTTTNNIANDSDGNYQLQINTSGKWRLDLTVDGKYSSDEGVGSKTIDLGNKLNSASVTVNQYENGPTKVYLLKGNQTLQEESSNSQGVETIYFYYQA